MELVNTHCHNVLSGHAVGTVEDYANAAERAGLSTLAFTEHYVLSEAMDPTHNVSLSPTELPEYLEQVEEAARTHPALEIICGCELDYLGTKEDRHLTPEDFRPFALVLGSVHYLDGWAFDHPESIDGWKEPGAADRIWRRYFEVWCEAVLDADKPYQVMSHPDLPKKFAFYPSFDLNPLYEQAAEACAQAERMIEVNTSGGYYACHEMFPAPAFLQAFRRAGVPATVGTDAHDPANVARDIEKAYGLLWDAGYRCVTVPTKTGDRRTIEL